MASSYFQIKGKKCQSVCEQKYKEVSRGPEIDNQLINKKIDKRSRKIVIVVFNLKQELFGLPANLG